MHSRIHPEPVLILAGIIIIAVIFTGCAHPEDQVPPIISGNKSCSEADNPPHQGSALLLREAERQRAGMNSTNYTHTTSVDEANGTYDYDCSGFVGYALSRADPCAFAVLSHPRPDTGDFYNHFIRLGTVPGPGGWMRILTPRELQPGDIIVWPEPDPSDPQSAGHIMIVSEIPMENPDRDGELLVRVIDSTTTRHADDTRAPGESGLGTGTVGIMTDSSGYPTGYYWRGGESKILRETDMAFARIA
ncbi:MAG TPA: hypothetical protein VLL74_03840 [Methanoregula sp.]|nr:hypothetical protein [Methanoregula sp.]